MMLLYIWIFTLFLIFIWGFFIVAKLHAYKFKNFSEHIWKVTNLLMYLLILLSILWYIVIIFSFSSSKNTNVYDNNSNKYIEETNY